MTKTIHIKLNDTDLLELTARRSEGTKVTIERIVLFQHGYNGTETTWSELDNPTRDLAVARLQKEFAE
jgi:hypothetical protein